MARIIFVFKGDHADLGHTVNNIGHILAEILVQLFKRGLGIFYGVVQKPGDHR